MSVKKFQVLRILVFITILILVSYGIVAGLSWKEQHEFLTDSLLYEDTTNGFTFRYPSTWSLISEQDLDYRNEQFVVGVNIVSESSTAIGVIVKQRSSQESLDAATVIDSIEKNFAETYTDFKKIKSRQVTRDEYQELDIEYTYNRSDKLNVHQRQRIFITATKVYIISGSSLLVNYAQREEDINHSIDSFQLTGSSLI